ncbi:MAG: SDR family oxidoreductase [Verrucomicrobiales bacterium]|nr:SDR family oxidoreductase [Verrucomicrobiales bacterium]
MTDANRSFEQQLLDDPQRWLVTGGAGFIGSHIIETLLSLDQEVVCLDNLSTGKRSNLEAAVSAVTPEQAKRLSVIEGHIADLSVCEKAVKGVSHVLHHAALGSVPLSIEDPVETHLSNATGTFHVFLAAKNAGVRRVVYASSSAVYGNEPGLPKQEEMKGGLLSPYAASKAIAEDYAESFANSYGMEFAGLRYFNVFGPRQDPSGPYAAVIPIWVETMLSGKPILINGDGENTRDFVYVKDVVQANLRAALAPTIPGGSRVYNVAAGRTTSLKELFSGISESLEELRPGTNIAPPVHGEFREGDVRHSSADFERARAEIGFTPAYDLQRGLREAMAWYAENAIHKEEG